MLGVNHIDYISQLDPRWKDKPLGDSKLTIGSDGCAVTCYSYVTDFFGKRLMPDQIAANGEYVKNGQVQWFKLPDFYYVDGNNFTYNFPIDQSLLDAFIESSKDEDKENRAAVIGLYITPPRNGTPYTHFVLPLWRSYGDIYVIDPIDGKSKNLFISYPNSHIYEVVYFYKGRKRVASKPVPPKY